MNYSKNLLRALLLGSILVSGLTAGTNKKECKMENKKQHKMICKGYYSEMKDGQKYFMLKPSKQYKNTYKLVALGKETKYGKRASTKWVSQEELVNKIKNAIEDGNKYTNIKIVDSKGQTVTLNKMYVNKKGLRRISKDSIAPCDKKIKKDKKYKKSKKGDYCELKKFKKAEKKEVKKAKKEQTKASKKAKKAMKKAKKEQPEEVMISDLEIISEK